MKKLFIKALIALNLISSTCYAMPTYYMTVTVHYSMLTHTHFFTSIAYNSFSLLSGNTSGLYTAMPHLNPANSVHVTSSIAQNNQTSQARMDTQQQSMPSMNTVSQGNQQRVASASANNNSQGAMNRILEKKGLDHLCFTGDTLISTKEGGDYVSKPISTIQVGDEVVSCNLDTAEGACEMGVVRKVIESKAKRLTTVTFNGETLKATGNHPVWVSEFNDFIPVYKLKPGHHFLSLSGQLVAVEKVGAEYGNFNVYNLEVDTHHNYYACDVLVHNCNVATALGVAVAEANPLGVGLVLGAAVTGVIVDQVQNMLNQHAQPPQVTHTGTTHTPMHQPNAHDTTTTMPMNPQTPMQTTTHNTSPLGHTGTTHTPILPQDAQVNQADMGLPLTRGNWSGERGNSDWFSDRTQVTDITGGMPVPFRDGYPNFSEWSQQTYEFPNLTGQRSDFGIADRQYAADHGLPNQTAAEQYRRDNGLTWHHHQDGRTLELVPTDLHQNVPHDGGASILRQQQQNATPNVINDPLL